MKKLLLLAILTMLCIGCSQGDQPLTEDEASTLAPERETTILQLVSDKERFLAQLRREDLFLLPSKNTQMITPVGTPTEVYVVHQGTLTKQEKIFQKEIYHLLWCYLNGNLVLVNVLDNQIRYISPEEDDDHVFLEEREEEYERLWDEIYKKHVEGKGQTPGRILDEIDSEVYRRMSKRPFFTSETLDSPPDEIEVVITHQFLYKYGRENDREKTMLFVDVKRNITRPHITFPQPLRSN